MYEKILSAAGLTAKEAEIYELILGIGQAPASEIYKKTAYKRGLVYKLLEQLSEKGLIIKIEKPRKVAIFRVEHPNKINERLEEQAQKVNYYKRTMGELMPQLVTNYNLAFNKPGVRFYEGEEGLRKVLADTLTAQETICTLVDVEAVVKYMDKINQEYVKQRERLHKQKKMVCVDSPFARKYLEKYHVDVTDTRFVDYTLYPFSSIMQIYDNKIAYISLSADAITSMIITDKNIYQMNKVLFNFIWSHSKAFSELSPITPVPPTESFPDSSNRSSAQ
ncbi:MAG: helix-turn-helix domain-containing protein [Parcubacteria group bacterium]|jgi:sugar-specific transcriptional regulator TrmB